MYKMCSGPMLLSSQQNSAQPELESFPQYSMDTIVFFAAQSFTARPIFRQDVFPSTDSLYLMTSCNASNATSG